MNETVYDLVAAAAKAHADDVAVIDVGPVTYADLMRRADRIAMAIARQGVDIESPIAVLAERNVDVVATLLAVWKIGACYVPIDIDDPPERQVRMIDRAGCELVVGHEALHRRMAAALGEPPENSDVPFLAIDDLDNAQPDNAEPDSDAGGAAVLGGDREGRLAYILFTSGSTGEPKGVEVEHRSVVNLLCAARDLLGFSSADRYLAVSTIGFDISVAELFVALITGGSVLLRDRSLLLDPAAFASDIREHRVTVAQTGPNVWALVLDAVADFPKLKVAISTGEAVAPALAARLADVADVAWNLYGPTEATVWATGHRLERSAKRIDTPQPKAPDQSNASDQPNASDQSSVSAPIGTALANVRTVVVDEGGIDVATGERGELWLGGRALARGYRDDAELTADRFVDRDGERWYRTGDTVACDPEGVLQYFGREDDQVKVRGVRIEPMEVESAILEIDGVSSAAATWFESSTGARSIVAAVVLEPGAEVASQDLYEALVDVLPAPMIPSRFVVCDELPRSPSGKVDRAAIRDLSKADRGSGVNELGGEVSATERELINIWKRTLGVDAVAPDDHFFTIGGDSLAAVTMMLDVEEAFSTSMPVRAVFEAPTLRHLAARIDSALDDPGMWAFESYVYQLVEGTGTPFFFFGVDLKMARPGMWTFGCPLYAVSQWAQGQGFLHARSVEDLALRQLAAITDVQPHGPYRLGGFSFGGIVALEMARLLRARGETVEILFLLGATEPFRTVDGPSGEDARGPFVARASSYLAGSGRPEGWGKRARDIAQRAMVTVLNLGGRVPIWQWLNYRIVHLYGRHPSYISTRILPKDRWPAYWYASLRLAKSYVAHPYDGPVAAVFDDEGSRSATWRSLLSADASTMFVDVQEHTALFDDPVARRWINFLNGVLNDL